mgnify:CR=1 FL=1
MPRAVGPHALEVGLQIADQQAVQHPFEQIDARVEPASLTKLMTAYAVFHALQDGKLKLDAAVPISEHAWKAEGSRTFVDVGTRVPRAFHLVVACH